MITKDTEFCYLSRLQKKWQTDLYQNISTTITTVLHRCGKLRSEIVTIGIDIDNVLVNTTESVLEYLNERTGLNLKLEDIKTYSIEDYVPKENRLLVPEAFESKHMWKKVDFIEGATAVIRNLVNDGHEIYFATATLPENLKKKMNHLSRNLEFLGLDYIKSHTICITNKQLLRFDVMIDDYLGNLCGERTYESICLDYPWNQPTDETVNDKHFHRVYNWHEVYVYIRFLLDKEY